jgi:hypothetical protein
MDVSEDGGYVCANCANHFCWWYVRVPITAETRFLQCPKTSKSRKRKDEEYCKYEIGKLIAKQVGKEAFSCLEPSKCSCGCKKSRYQLGKKVVQGVAIGGAVLAGITLIGLATAGTALTMGGALPIAAPIAVGGAGLIGGAGCYVERLHLEHQHKKALVSRYKGKLIDPHDFGIALNVEGSTSLSYLYQGYYDDMTEIRLSSDCEEDCIKAKAEAAKVKSENKRRGIRTNSGYCVAFTPPCCASVPTSTIPTTVTPMPQEPLQKVLIQPQPGCAAPVMYQSPMQPPVLVVPTQPCPQPYYTQYCESMVYQQQSYPAAQNIAYSPNCYSSSPFYEPQSVILSEPQYYGVASYEYPKQVPVSGI